MNMMNLELSRYVKEQLELQKWLREESIKIMRIPDYRFGEGKEDWGIEIIHREFLKKYNLL